MMNKYLEVFVLLSSCCFLFSQGFVVTTPTTRPSSSLASWNKFVNRFNTIESAGYRSFDSTKTNDSSTSVKTAGLSIKKIHNPITYLALSLLAGLKWNWCFRSPYYWFAVAFCVKWYRARYVFKIPVWDRQPNWNNIITSKEQEKDLKAYTCKNCGSTLFIAKTREFFFEGDTGIGGLGCFTCGAKGKDNFIMDRDRIVEDVADIDDYFEYERPLDFVSRAERRELLKQTKGDEEKANQILLERANAGSGEATTNAVDAEIVESSKEDVEEPESEPEVEEPSFESQTDDETDDNKVDEPNVEETKMTESEAIKDEEIAASDAAPEPVMEENPVDNAESVMEEKPVDKVQDTKQEKRKVVSKPLRPPPPPVNEEFDLSELDMDL